MAHDHDHAHGAGGDEPDPKATPTFVTGVIGILITIITILFVTILYRHEARMERERQVIELEDPNPELRRLHERQLQDLRGQPRELKPGEPRKGLPIERAMQLVAAEKQG